MDKEALKIKRDQAIQDLEFLENEKKMSTDPAKTERWSRLINSKKKEIEVFKGRIKEAELKNNKT